MRTPVCVRTKAGAVPVRTCTEADEWKWERQLDWRSCASDTDRRFILMELYGPANVINTVEFPINPAARPVFTPGVVSSTVWAASPAAQRGLGIQSFYDATFGERLACAAGAKPLP
jgi:hypothetical protein